MGGVVGKEVGSSVQLSPSPRGLPREPTASGMWQFRVRLGARLETYSVMADRDELWAPGATASREYLLRPHSCGLVFGKGGSGLNSPQSLEAQLCRSSQL